MGLYSKKVGGVKQQRIGSRIGYAVRATDGELGKVDEFYFDDEIWTLRYIVAETGSWLKGRKVLISLAAIGEAESESGTFSVSLTRDLVRSSPDIDTQRPIYRQHEVELHKRYQKLWRGRKLFHRPDGSRVCNGTILARISTSQGNP